MTNFQPIYDHRFVTRDASISSSRANAWVDIMEFVVYTTIPDILPFFKTQLNKKITYLLTYNAVVEIQIMASREEQIARHLSGLLSSNVAPAVEREMRQSITDYFLNDEVDDDGELSDMDVATADDDEVNNEAAPVPTTLSLSEPGSLSLDPDEICERTAFDVGAHSFPGDEGNESISSYNLPWLLYFGMF